MQVIRLLVFQENLMMLLDRIRDEVLDKKNIYKIHGCMKNVFTFTCTIVGSKRAVITLERDLTLL